MLVKRIHSSENSTMECDIFYDMIMIMISLFIVSMVYDVQAIRTNCIKPVLCIHIYTVFNHSQHWFGVKVI